MAEFVQQGAPHFFAKNRVIAAGRRPQIFDEYNDLRGRSGTPFRAENIANKQPQRLRRNAGLNESLAGRSVNNQGKLRRRLANSLGQLTVKRLGDLNGAAPQIVKGGCAASQFHRANGQAPQHAGWRNEWALSR